MDALVVESEKLWPYLPWTSSPLHGVPLATRKAYLLDLLYKKVTPPCYEPYTAICHPIAECPRSMLLMDTTRRQLEICPNEEPYMGWYLPLYRGPTYDGTCCIHEYVLFDVLCSLTTISDIHGAMTIYGRDFFAYMMVDHAIEMEKWLQTFQGLEDNIMNFLLRVSPESPPDIFERLRIKGCHVMYPFLQINMHPRTVLWGHQHFPQFCNVVDVSHYMYQLSHCVVSVVCGPRALAQIVLLAICLNHELTPATVAVLLRKIVPPYTPLVTALLEHMEVEMKAGRIDIDHWEFGNNEGRGPCNRAMRVIAANEEFVRRHLVYFLRNVPISPANDLDIDYWVLFLCKMGVIHHKSQVFCITRGGGVCCVDRRVINFSFGRTADVPKAPTPFIPFHKPFDMVLRNQGHPDLHVHLDKLMETCSFFKSLDESKLQFKPCDGLEQRCLDIGALLAHCVKDLGPAISALLHHIYTGQVPTNISVETVVELNELAWYLGNESCINDSTFFLWREYLMNFEDHFECSSQCSICRCWHKTKQPHA